MSDETLWTIDELGAQASLALSVDYAGQPNGRVSEIPNRRTIRYYQTLGLVDRPARMRGRTALYGRRHLLQVVAIKRLQADGLSLAEVQARLAGLSENRLASLAQVPPELIGGQAVGSALENADEHATPRRLSKAGRAHGFWSAEPAPVGPARANRAAGESEAISATVTGRSVIAGTPSPEPPSPESISLLRGVPLAEGVTLLFAPGRALDATDVDALRAAAAPLLKLLRYRFSTR